MLPSRSPNSNHLHHQHPRLSHRPASLAFAMTKTAKRRRKNGVTDIAADTEKTPPLITCLPFELIAEVLLYSTSLADVLSLSRTCKHFHATLVQNAVASFIWKRVRARTTPPIPDPIKLGLSEPQLANFIYGGGKCSVHFHCLVSPLLCSPLSYSRNAAEVRPTCTHHFQREFASAGIRRVVRNTC